MRARTSVHDVPLTDPLRPTAGVVAGGGRAGTIRPLILLRLEAADGSIGYGEAAPLKEYDGVSVERVMDALATHTSILATNEWAEMDVRAVCANADPLPQALAAIDLALWDLAGRRAGKPVSELLGAPVPEPVAVNATIGAVAPADAALEALRAREAGFGCVKVKVGTPDDRQRLAAIREAVGPDMLIRVDANGAWDQLTAPERIRALARFDVELFEEPVHGGDAIEAVARAVPNSALATDESAGLEFGMFVRRRCDAVCLKVAASGGITGLLAEAKRARELRYEVYVASTLDGPLGIAAALHAAALLRPERHCGLATLGRFEPEVPPALVPVDGQMTVPAGPGLGEGLVAWYGA
jgi:L-alanine-DL-glutamate epimerase-like enolase superfamily enzyme